MADFSSLVTKGGSVFYLLCAFLVLVIGKKRLSIALVVFATLINILVGLNEYLDNDSIFWTIKSIKVFGFDYLAWFSIGVLIYDLRLNLNFVR